MKKFYTPRNLAFLLMFPINIVIPLVYTSVAFGVPYPYFKHNNDVNSFGEVFESITLPEGTVQRGKTFRKVGNLYDNLKNEEEAKKALEEKIEEDSTQVPVGNFDTSDEVNDDSPETVNTCDFFAAMVITSKQKQEDLSKELLNQFSAAIEASVDSGKYSLVVSSELRLVPINSQSLQLEVEDFKLDILKDFKLKGKNFDFDAQPTYVVYMLNDNVSKGKDPRCK